MRNTPHQLIAAFMLLLFFSAVTGGCKKDEEIIQPDPVINQPAPPTDPDLEGDPDEEEVPVSTLSLLRIELSGMQNTNGKINVALYNSSGSFNDPNLAYRETFPPVTSTTMVIEIDELPAGEYAFGLFHDENENNTLDTNWLNIPQEGFAFSNNAMGTFGPPSWNQAKFTIPENSTVTQIIQLQHF
jgi:uncharacterized protein (DUF2141 family)